MEPVTTPIEAPPVGAPPPEAPPEPRTPDQEPSLAEHETANQARPRHRARSQQASPEDVPRIRELTAKLRATEAERDALKGTNGSVGAATESTPVVPAAAASPTRPAEPSRAPAREPFTPPSTIPVVAADKDPEPNPEEYVDHPEKNYVKDQARWEARQEIREANERATKAATEANLASERTRLTQHWNTRAAAAKTRYADFEQVAYSPTPIKPGSMVDGFIVESDSGLDVLYYLQKNPTERDAMLALPLFDPAAGTYPQIEALSSLARRLNPTSRTQAVDTGSAVPPLVPRAPRPPNPVRTGPMSTGDEPPGDDASLADHEKFYQPRRTRR